MAATRQIIVRLSDNVIEVTNLRNTVTRALLSAATVTATLRAADNTILSGGTVTNPLTLSAVAGEPGSYRGTFPAQDVDTPAALANGDLVTVTIAADGGTGLFRTKTFIAEVKDT